MCDESVRRSGQLEIPVAETLGPSFFKRNANRNAAYGNSDLRARVLHMQTKLRSNTRIGS
jgi:hypothetical protein